MLLSSVCIKLGRVLVATDIDECASHPCENGGTCEDKVNSFKCTCVYDLYQGSVCDEGKLIIVVYCHYDQGYASQLVLAIIQIMPTGDYILFALFYTHLCLFYMVCMRILLYFSNVRYCIVCVMCVVK